MLYRVTSNYFCAGLIMRNGKVVRAAPIIKYMKGWNIVRIRQYAARRNWTVERVES
jgi:hypothetical protein